jgi:hypothetical protein
MAPAKSVRRAARNKVSDIIMASDSEKKSVTAKNAASGHVGKK